MRANFNGKIININDSGLGCLLTFVVIAFLLGAVGLQWIVNSFLILVTFLIVSPAIAFWLLRWWLKRNLVEDSCPVCAYTFTGLNNLDYHCPNCGESLQVESGRFIRKTPPGIIEVTAVEVLKNEE